MTRGKMMLVQVLLPFSGAAANTRAHALTKRELTDAFGGLTRYSRAPAEGLWKKGRATDRDAIVVYEVMTPRLDRAWWRRYRHALEKRFHQEEVVVRAERIETI